MLQTSTPRSSRDGETSRGVPHQSASMSLQVYIYKDVFFFLSLIFNITVDFYLNLGDRILFQILQNVSRLRYPLFIYLHILA